MLCQVGLSEVRDGKQVSKLFRINEKIKIKSPVAKTKYVKSRCVWIVYWMRASGKWERYEPNPEINNISEFFEILEKDEYGCFWG